MEEPEGVQFHYVGRKVLKGVYNGRPYPLFLMAMLDNMPEIWEWEAEEDEGLVALRRNTPMNSEEILELLGRIQSYLNQMCHAGIESLEFS